jgi:hypothetical protein
MSKLARSDEPKVNQVQMNFRILKFKLELAYYLAFDIHLAFACLPVGRDFDI